MLPWLAGPYIPLPDRPGWSALQSRAVVPRTRTALTADGGVRRLADVTADLADLEVDAQQLVLWLGANGVTVIHDLAVVVGGPLADAVERVSTPTASRGPRSRLPPIWPTAAGPSTPLQSGRGASGSLREAGEGRHRPRRLAHGGGAGRRAATSRAAQSWSPARAFACGAGGPDPGSRGASRGEA